MSDLHKLRTVSLKFGFSLSEVSPDEIPYSRNAFSIDSLGKLNGISLSRNGLDNADFLSNLKNLRFLNLNENYISDIQFISYMKRLTYLDLSQNRIRKISSLQTLKELTHLNLSGNLIEDPETIGRLTNLTHIVFWASQLTLTAAWWSARYGRCCPREKDG